MNTYEKRIAAMERKELHHLYCVDLEPISDNGKLFFNTPGEGVKKEYAKLSDYTVPLENRTLNAWEYPFYYDDPAETEEERLKIVERSAIETLHRKNNGNFVLNTLRKTTEIRYNEDYKFVITKVM